MRWSELDKSNWHQVGTIHLREKLQGPFIVDQIFPNVEHLNLVLENTVDFCMDIAKMFPNLQVFSVKSDHGSGLASIRANFPSSLVHLGIDHRNPSIRFDGTSFAPSCKATKELTLVIRYMNDDMARSLCRCLPKSHVRLLYYSQENDDTILSIFIRHARLLSLDFSTNRLMKHLRFTREALEIYGTSMAGNVKIRHAPGNSMRRIKVGLATPEQVSMLAMLTSKTKAGDKSAIKIMPREMFQLLFRFL